MLYKYIKGLSFLFIICGLSLFYSAYAEIKSEFVFGDEVVIDSDTRYLWNAEVYTRKNISESGTFCSGLSLAGISDWSIPLESDLVGFLTTYKNQTVKPGSGTYENVFQWTTSRPSIAPSGEYEYRIVKLQDGNITTDKVVETASTREIGIRCIRKLPVFDTNGTATAPTFLSDQISVTSFKTGEKTTLKSYWFNTYDLIDSVKARYKEKNSSAWTEINLAYDQGFSQFRARYYAEITVNTAGTYDVQFLATAKDGSSVTESAWSGSGLTFTVANSGESTPPELVAGNATLTGQYTGENIEFYARWKDTDGEPYLFDTIMHYRKQGDTTWSSDKAMTLSRTESTFTEFKNNVQVNGTAGIYEVQFKASSATDSTKTNASTSAWLPVTPRTFEIKSFPVPEFVSGEATTDNKEITFISEWKVSDENIPIISVIARYKIDEGTFQTISLPLQAGGSYQGKIPFVSGKLSYQFEAIVESKIDGTQATVYSPSKYREWAGNKSPSKAHITLVGTSESAGKYITTYNISATDPESDNLHIDCTFSEELSDTVTTVEKHEFRNVASGAINKRGIEYASTGKKIVSCNVEDVFGNKNTEISLEFFTIQSEAEIARKEALEKLQREKEELTDSLAETREILAARETEQINFSGINFENLVAQAGEFLGSEASQQLDDFRSSISDEIRSDDPKWEEENLHGSAPVPDGIKVFSYGVSNDTIPEKFQYLLEPYSIKPYYGYAYDDPSEGNYPAFIQIENKKNDGFSMGTVVNNIDELKAFYTQARESNIGSFGISSRGDTKDISIIDNFSGVPEKLRRYLNRIENRKHWHLLEPNSKFFDLPDEDSEKRQVLVYVYDFEIEVKNTLKPIALIKALDYADSLASTYADSLRPYIPNFIETDLESISNHEAEAINAYKEGKVTFYTLTYVSIVQSGKLVVTLHPMKMPVSFANSVALDFINVDENIAFLIEKLVDNSEVARQAVEAIEAGKEEWNEFKLNHPEAALNIETTIGITDLFIKTKGSKQKFDEERSKNQISPSLIKKANPIKAKEANKPHLDDGKDAPYVANRAVFEFEEDGKTTYVRFFNPDAEKNSTIQSGTWMASIKDIKGLSAKEVAEKLALPNIPTRMTYVTPPKGWKMRVGTAASNFNKKGGGIQFEAPKLINKEPYIPVGSYSSPQDFKKIE